MKRILAIIACVFTIVTASAQGTKTGNYKQADVNGIWLTTQMQDTDGHWLEIPAGTGIGFAFSDARTDGGRYLGLLQMSSGTAYYTYTVTGNKIHAYELDDQAHVSMTVIVHSVQPKRQMNATVRSASGKLTRFILTFIESE